MAQRGRRASYTAAQALRIILQSDDDSGQEDSDVSDDAEDHLSEPSDYSDTESIQPAPDGNNGVNNLPADQNPPEPVRGRGRARVRAQGRVEIGIEATEEAAKEAVKEAVVKWTDRTMMKIMVMRILQLSMRYKTC